MTKTLYEVRHTQFKKMAIERGVIGDSSTGYIQVNNKQTSGKKSLLIEPQEEAKEDDNE